MPLPVIANTYRVAMMMVGVEGALPPHTVNVIHVRTTMEDEEGIAATIFSSSAAREANLYAFQPTNYSLVDITVTKLDGTSGGVAVSGAGGSGQQSDDWVPQGAVVISLSTGGRGPQARGRIYLGPCSEGQQTAGVLYQPTADSCLSGWQGFQDDLASDNCELVVASYRHSVARSVSSIALHPLLRTMRRRATR
jgi:hypothetical protein